MKTNQRTARIVGALILIATVTHRLGSRLLDSLHTAPDYLLQVSQNSTQVVIGAVLGTVDAAAVAAIGILLFPILRKHNEAIALGYAGTRLIECVLLLVAGISSLSLIPLSQHFVQAGAPDAASVQAVGTFVVAQKGLVFQIAMIALGLGSLPFCHLLYRARIIPRALSVLGLIGYGALIMGGVAELFGLNVSMMHFLPGNLFDLFLPIWLIVKGFNASVIASQSAATDGNERQPALSAT